MLYTAQYRYRGQDRLDITVKGNDPLGHHFAPTWSMVKNLKSGDLGEQVYTALYHDLLTNRHNNESDFRVTTLVIAQRAAHGDVTFVCFCPAGAFCHRHILVQRFLARWPSLQYGGERQL